MKTMLLGLLLTSFSAFAALTEVDRAEFPLKSILKDSGFETGKAAWSTVGSTISIVTSGSNLLEGKASATWDASATTMTLRSSAVTIPKGLYGKNGEAHCSVQTPSGTATHKLEVLQSGNTLSYASVLSSTLPVKTSTNFIFPSSGSIQLGLVSQADEPLIAIDGCYLGKATNLGNGNFATDALPLTSLSTDGFGTITGLTAYSERVGDKLKMWGYFKVGTTTATSAAIALPAGLAVEYAKASTTSNAQIVGHTANLVSAGPTALYSTDKAPILFLDGSTTTKVFFAYRGTSSAFEKANGSTLWAANDAVSFQFEVPIVGWVGQTAFSPDVSSSFWSGYHAADCLWSTTSSSYSDYGSGDASCTFAQVVNTNFGTVSSYTISSNNGPGIVFTPVKAGAYEVCADISGSGPATAIVRQGHRLYDGANVIGQVEYQTETTAQPTETHKVCGLVNASNVAAKTYYLQSLTGSGTLTVAAPSGSSLSSIYWTIKQISQSISAPLLVGSVTSQSLGLERIERLQFGGASEISQCTSSPCTIYRQSGSWITSVVRNGTGDYTVNIASGIFSARPTCTALDGNHSNSGGIMRSASTAATATLLRLNTALYSGPTSEDAAVDLICMGPR